MPSVRTASQDISQSFCLGRQMAPARFTAERSSDSFHAILTPTRSWSLRRGRHARPRHGVSSMTSSTVFSLRFRASS